ncbi:MAG: glycoside hydrolase family 31 protein [Candidatus Competibacteraceae bacterium]|jgi:alpha-glucosidase|nr:glycoside hydrolase family 31 protein [Candidatus Competibacteraceae bacterium]
MLFGKKTHPLNFEYGNDWSLEKTEIIVTGNSFELRIQCHVISDFCTRLHFDNSWVSDKHNYSDGVVEQYRTGSSIQPHRHQERGVFNTPCATLELGPAQLAIRMATGPLLETVADGFGCNGQTFTLQFDIRQSSGSYGFGERTKRLNKIGESMEFWTVDVVAVFPHTYDRDDYDPNYVAIPLAIIKSGAGYIGLYFDNPGHTLIDVGNSQPGRLQYQSTTGNNDVYIIAGPSLREVVRNFTALTGRAALPAPWSLGYHQCRWSYTSEAELRALKEHFERSDIPVSALWYDIDYMDGNRLFSWDRESFPNPAGFNNELKEAGIRTVAIIDPGVKREPGYEVYDSGQQSEVFCKTLSGRDYVGRVWPGDTVFPDFTQAPAQDWWADWLGRFVRESRLDGVWLDMNDPATGYSNPQDMRFAQGSVAHEHYHNQYAHFMAKTSHQAVTVALPDQRPFLLTRSGWTGTQRYSAVWTGDNVSHWQHLRMAIPCTLNLGLSGVAHSGPDVGGFLGHTTPELLIRWYQACFLFPFFRNHSARNTKPQEPWQFGEPCTTTIRETIKTRYRLLPYLYSCAFQHYLTGDPLLRPLLYEYDDPAYENLDDQYLLGDALLVAPILTADSDGPSVFDQGVRKTCRHVALPPGWWFDLNRGEWLSGGRILSYAAALDEVPLFVRDGAIIPYYSGPLRNGMMDLREIELHVFSHAQPGQAEYFIDDQLTQGYARGEYNTVAIDATIEEDRLLMTLTETGHYPTDTICFKPVWYGTQKLRQAVVTTNGQIQSYELHSQTRPWLNRNLAVLA